MNTKPKPLHAVIIGVVMFILTIGIWQFSNNAGWISDIAPTPANTFARGVEILSDPFYQDGPASVVAPIDKLSILVTVAFSGLVFHERLTRRSSLGLALIVAGTLAMLI